LARPFWWASPQGCCPTDFLREPRLFRLPHALQPTTSPPTRLDESFCANLIMPRSFAVTPFPFAARPGPRNIFTGAAAVSWPRWVPDVEALPPQSGPILLVSCEDDYHREFLGLQGNKSGDQEISTLIRESALFRYFGIWPADEADHSSRSCSKVGLDSTWTASASSCLAVFNRASQTHGAPARSANSRYHFARFRNSNESGIMLSRFRGQRAS
jgi:hypothetical protein